MSIESFGKEDAHPPPAGDEVFDHRALALPPIRHHIDRIAFEQQLDILAHLIRPLRLERQSVTERTDRLEAEAPDFRTSSMGCPVIFPLM